ncbi:MAG: cytochrome c family protein [Bacteroidetes bacterium]|nr:cytochrome c family protein [Bacteroidota bacterium]
MKNKIHILMISWLLMQTVSGLSQISPGDLAEPHAHLEGLSNCTKCHVLGDKVSNDKCLDCHQLLKSRVDQNKGYHASSEVKGKNCFSCHSDHHGRKFEMIRFDEDEFDHDLTGYKLEGAHDQKQCKDCHKNEFITNKEIRQKQYTFLGLNTECLSCHDDYHQKTLSSDCASCHNFEKFKPAPKFNHDNTQYPLLGQHQEVECLKCHTKEMRNGKQFQIFKGLEFESCVNCHQDVHNNKFGPNCTDCHSEISFHQIKSMDQFNHDKTDYKLEGKHRYVDCKKCHKTNYTDPIYTNRCNHCHVDYHQKEFVRNDVSPDCADCHTVYGFEQTSFTIERHNESEFRLNGAHMATPCFACHKKEGFERWRFREIGTKCVDCHEDIHQPYLDKKYYPEATCRSCHSETRWSDIAFDHNRTDYELKGAHESQTCRSCHFRKDEDGTIHQLFTDLPSSCITCHKDIHFGQFEKEGVIDCYGCHDYKAFKPASRFDHNNTKFSLEGAHEKVACKACHKPTQTADNIVYIQYKIDHRCEACHK